MFVVILCRVESVSGARFVLSSEKATASVSTFDVRHTLMRVFADDKKQTAGRNQFCESFSTLQQRVAGCAAWFAHRKEMMK